MFFRPQGRGETGVDRRDSGDEGQCATLLVYLLAGPSDWSIKSPMGGPSKGPGLVRSLDLRRMSFCLFVCNTVNMDVKALDEECNTVS